MKKIKRVLSVVLCLCMFNCFLNVLALATDSYASSVALLYEDGDVNGDGAILTDDARLALSCAIGIAELSYLQINRADMDSDGIITSEDVVMILKLCADLTVDYLPEISQITPYQKHDSSVKVKYCRVTADYAETFSTSVSNDRSNPLYTPLLKDSYDEVTSTDSEFVYLASGRKVYVDDVTVFSGYTMPSNEVYHQDIIDYQDGSTDLYFALDWRVPFTVTFGPQSYETGYNSREFNLVNDTFTATYMDIKFYNTTVTDGFSREYGGSSVIKNSKWIMNSTSETATLRVYLNNTGSFYGYKAYYNDKNYLIISVKEKPQSLDGMVIELDPGHGGTDPGACSGGLKECVIAYDIAQQLEKLLVAQGATVVYSYDENVSPVPDIAERRLTALEDNPDLYISIHLNSSSSTSAVGSSVYYYKNYSCQLSKCISTALPSAVKSKANYSLSNDGSHFYPFKVTRIENCPSVLVECGYISNSAERNMMNSSSGKKAIATGIFNGIVNYINAQ